MTRPSWREEFIAWFVCQVFRNGGSASLCSAASMADGAVRLMAHSRALHRLAECSCNHGLTKRQQAREDRLALRVCELVDQYLPGWVVNVGGDPRGCVVNLYAPGVDPESGTGIGVPSR